MSGPVVGGGGGVGVRRAPPRHGGPPPDGPLTVPVRSSTLPRAALYEAWSRTPWPRAERIAGPADVVHATTWAMPATRRPLVVTVHDLAFLDDPTHFTRRGNAFFRRSLDLVRRRADAVVVPSAATADDCVRHGLQAARLHVVPHGVRVPPVGTEAVTAFRDELGLRRDYILWCGTREPRKNLDRLVKAYLRLAPAGTDLVLVGPSGWGEVGVGAGHDDRVHVVGRLDEGRLHAAYAGARAFAFPSIREGFGLPVLEAMAHGIPVLTSRATACAEVAGDTAVLVDPLDERSITDGLAEVLSAGRELGARGRERAATFTWARAAEQTIGAYLGTT